MSIFDLYSNREISLFLQSQKELRAGLERQKIEVPRSLIGSSRQESCKPRGRPRKIESDALLNAYERELFAGDWGEEPVSLREFCKKNGVSESLFREIRKRATVSET